MICLKKEVELISKFVEENSLNSYWSEIINTAKGDDYSGDLYAIYQNDEIVGCVEVFLGADNLYVSMIEVSDTYNHIGRNTIKLLFEMYDDIDVITGESLPEAIGFWYTIGASFDCDEEEPSLDELYELEMSLSFSLDREKFLDYLKSEVV